MVMWWWWWWRFYTLGGYGDWWDYHTDMSSACEWGRSVDGRIMEESPDFISSHHAVFAAVNSTKFSFPAAFSDSYSTSYRPDPDANKSTSTRVSSDPPQFICSRRGQARCRDNSTLYKLVTVSRLFWLEPQSRFKSNQIFISHSTKQLSRK